MHKHLLCRSAITSPSFEDFQRQQSNAEIQNRRIKLSQFNGFYCEIF